MIRYCVPQGSSNPSLVVHLHPSEPFGPLQWSTMGPTGDKQRACELTAGVATYCELMAGPFFLACELMAGVSSRGLTYTCLVGWRFPKKASVGG